MASKAKGPSSGVVVPKAKASVSAAAGPKSRDVACAKRVSQASRSPLIAAAKGVLKVDKASPPAKAKIDVASAEPAKPASPAKPTGVVYDGKPLDVQSALPFFTAVTPEQMVNLSKTSDVLEQLPARMLLEIVGDKDVSWENAIKSLREGSNFIKEVLDMEHAAYLTRKSIERFDALGKLQPKALQEKDPAAFAIAVYMEAVILAGKEKLGMNVVPVTLAPGPDETPPDWPIWAGIQDLPGAVAEAVRWNRTPLILCAGKVHVVDTYFAYQACSLVDAKWILNKVDIKHELDVPQMREQLRQRLVSALKFGQPIHIAMSNSAVSLQSKYCADTEFPESLFKQDLWFKKDVHSKVIRDSDLLDWPGAFPGRMKDVASYAFVTSDFSLESAQEFLPEVLPHFQSMAIIQVDPATIDA